jgi:hypothetical protein
MRKENDGAGIRGLAELPPISSNQPCQTIFLFSNPSLARSEEDLGSSCRMLHNYMISHIIM